jgi:hypothetical protein
MLLIVYNAFYHVIERYEAISDRLCFLNISPLIAAEGYYFLLDQKVAKNQVSKKTSWRTGLCPAKQAEPRAAVFCPARLLRLALQQNPLMPFLAHMTVIVLPAFARSCFADILVLLSTLNSLSPTIHIRQLFNNPRKPTAIG